MITIDRNGTKVIIRIKGSGPTGKHNFPAEWNAGQEWIAGLLKQNLEEGLRDKLIEIKKAMYDLGRKHQKGKQRRLRPDNFWGDFLTSEAEGCTKG